MQVSKITIIGLQLCTFVVKSIDRSFTVFKDQNQCPQG